MCGILGLVTSADSASFPPALSRRILRDLFALSETRGGEASGIAVRRGDSVSVFKSEQSASVMLGDAEFEGLIEKTFAPADPRHDGLLAALGHCRLVTNGREADRANNQPVIAGGLVGVHNGIVVNDGEIWRDNSDLQRASEVDSEVVFALIARNLARGEGVSAAVASAFRAIEGEASIAAFTTDRASLVLATNTGSIYWAADDAAKFMFFASEETIVRSVIAKHLRGRAHEVTIHHLVAGRGLTCALDTGAVSTFDLASPNPETRSAMLRPLVIREHIGRDDRRRCTRCILPTTFPLIEFDAKGVCNFCRNFVDVRPEGREAIEKIVAPYRRRDGRPDCIVALSGGRDSCYGLHVIKKELGLNPIAFTYDWGLVTDLARRNQARICGKLGVEHIWRTADISAKRGHVRANLEAWMKRPRLGMMPLLTAGDKEFYRLARRLRREVGSDLVFFCAGNRFEETRFKTGFAGVSESLNRNIMTRISVANKAQLAAYYAGQIVLNPRYLNRSLPDALWAFVQTYLIRDDFVYLYHYVPWDEETVVRTLQSEYGWERAPDTTTTWRIGDATAAFYNFVYFTVAGFSEHDTFRSNQIRAGALTRDQALGMAARDNKPRYDAIEEYARLVGISASDLFRAVNAMPKIFAKESQ